MNAITQQYTGTTEEWENENPVLFDAVWAVEVTADGKRLLKLGDGVHPWNELPYITAGNIGGLPETLAGMDAALEQETAERQAADALLAPLESPAFTGEPTVPEPGTESNNGQAAPTKWVMDRIDEAIAGGLTPPFSVVQGGTGATTAAAARNNLGVTAAVAAEATAREAADTTEATAREAADTTEATARQTADAALNIKVEAVQGRGGYLNAHDFGAADLSDAAGQEALTDYALEQIGITDPDEIWNGTHVKNLYVDPATIDEDHPDGIPDGTVWALTNTPDTDPPIFEWADDGPETVGQATNNRMGVVKGVADPGDGSADGKVTVLPGGTGKVIGWERRLPPGVIMYSVMNPEHLALYRLLPLEGTVIDVSASSIYCGLGETVYCGDDDNPTAEAFYRCDQDGTRNVEGDYLKLPDARGIGLTGAGTQTVNGVAYDGGDVGEFSADMFQGHYHNHSQSTTIVGVQSASGYFFNASNPSFAQVNVTLAVTSPKTDGTNGTPRTGNYTRGPALAARACITY